jgi:hypothetical protein
MDAIRNMNWTRFMPAFTVCASFGAGFRGTMLGKGLIFLVESSWEDWLRSGFA